MLEGWVWGENPLALQLSSGSGKFAFFK